MSNRDVNVETGIEIWEGLPGSGKSYGAVKRLIDAIIQTRRPVYTNLPLNHRVIKKYLRVVGGDPLLARYLLPITREHLHRFVLRNQALSELREARRAEGIPDWRIEEEFFATHGPHIEKRTPALCDLDSNVIEWLEPNWICEGAVLVLDEFHRWADQRQQQKEDPAYLTYATMHRHHLHLILILTQDAMQVSLPWRRNCHVIVRCTDKRRLPFMFGIPLPVLAFAYEYYPHEYADIKTTTAKPKPVKTVVEVPAFSGRVIFRLYNSFTHLGSFRTLTRKLEAARERIEAGARTGIEQTAREEDDGMFKLIGKMGAGTALLLFLGASIVGATMIFGGGGEKRQDEPASETPASTPTTNARASSTRAPQVTAVGKSYAIANGVMVKMGQNVGPWKLEGADVETGRTIWSMDDRTVDVPIGVRSTDESSGLRPGAVTARAILGRTAPDADR